MYYKKRNIMDNKTKLELIAKKYNATMDYAEKLLNEYVDTSIEQAIYEVFNNLSETERMLLLYILINESSEILLNSLINAIDKSDDMEEIDDEEEIDEQYEEIDDEEEIDLSVDYLHFLFNGLK